uniref:Sperm microtubule inner protein 1 C-terminal domain-containing protein n=1 Tax=Schistosoma haematobium TaxID=6185 RepID=A0A095C635_SCHHA
MQFPVNVATSFGNRYLHDRYKLNLEDKFQFPILSSMEYGWGHADLISKSTAQSRKFGRQCVIEDSFYRRTGIPFKHGAGMIGLDKYSF